MSTSLARARMFRVLMLLGALVLLTSAGFGQTAVIEPCPATPTPAKPGFVNPQAKPAKINTGKNARVTETLVDSSIPADADVEKVLSPYTEKVRALSVIIGSLEGELKKSGVGAGTLGNFVTDAIKADAKTKLGKPVALSIMNSGGLRKNEITPGELRASDIFELLPFENALVAIDLTGVQLIKVLQVAIRDAQAGARIQFRWNEQNKAEFISAKLIDDEGVAHDIDSQAIYTVVTIDYLLKLGSGSYSILQEGKNARPLNITLRDAVMDYVKSETAAGRPIRARLDERYVQIGPGPAKPENPQ